MAKKSSMAMPAVMPSKSEDDYRAEDDHRTLMRADEVRSDSTRFGRARGHAMKVMRSTQRLYGRTSARGR